MNILCVSTYLGLLKISLDNYTATTATTAAATAVAGLPAGCSRKKWKRERKLPPSPRPRPYPRRTRYPTRQSLGDHFLLLKSEREGFYSSFFCLPSECTSGFQAVLWIQTRVKWEGSWAKNLLPDCSYFKYWFPSPFCLLSFTFENPQIAISCTLSRVFSCIQ